MRNNIEDDRRPTRCPKCRRVFSPAKDSVGLCPFCGSPTKEILPRKCKVTKEDYFDAYKGY